MGKKSGKYRAFMTSKPRPLGNNAIGIVDDAIMANQMCLNELVKIINNDLSKEGVIRAVAVAIKEASEVQLHLSKVRYLGK